MPQGSKPGQGTRFVLGRARPRRTRAFRAHGFGAAASRDGRAFRLERTKGKPPMSIDEDAPEQPHVDDAQPEPATAPKRRDDRKHRGRDERMTVDVGEHMKKRLKRLAAGEGMRPGPFVYQLIREALATRKRGKAPTPAE